MGGNTRATESTVRHEHARNVYAEGELGPEAGTRDSRIVQDEGGRQVVREVEEYNLDVIISVGYRVKSHQGTQFRIWATQVAGLRPSLRSD